MGAPLFTPNDPNGQMIEVAASIAGALRGRRGRRPAVPLGVILIGAGVLAIVGLAVVSNLLG